VEMAATAPAAAITQRVGFSETSQKRREGGEGWGDEGAGEGRRRKLL
jgi:hypothetical protein